MNIIVLSIAGATKKKIRGERGKREKKADPEGLSTANSIPRAATTAASCIASAAFEPSTYSLEGCRAFEQPTAAVSRTEHRCQQIQAALRVRTQTKTVGIFKCWRYDDLPSRKEYILPLSCAIPCSPGSRSTRSFLSCSSSSPSPHI
jgi:hypothetical protein